jgi:aspartyl-tRNA synthetase
MIKFIEKIPAESIVDLTATVVIPKQEIKSCSKKVELDLKTIFIVSRSASNLPF